MAIVKSGDEWERHFEGRKVPEEYRFMRYPQPERSEQDKAYMDAAETQQADAQAAEPQHPRPVVPIVLTCEKPAEKIKEITARLEQGLQAIFDSDRYKEYTVMQIYENLLSNSIRYAKSDIAISVVIENNNLVISVSDDGCGFKNIEIEKATLPFYKSSKDISTEHLGLGLNISKILSERHGGNIQIANNKAGGACVTVKINCNES